METLKIIEQIKSGKCSLGIELGSTRIKSVLISESIQTIAVGTFDWENEYRDDNWTYSLDLVWKGIQESYKDLTNEVFNKFNVKISRIKNFGVSAMMHGYLVFDENDELLVPFRTWRNGNTTEAAKTLSELFQFNIPERWSIAHLYQAILNKEEHVDKVSYITTLSGYVHWRLTGEKVLGIGDASGMFPVDPLKRQYNSEYLKIFNQKNLLGVKLEDVLPKICIAGELAGNIPSNKLKLIDPSSVLKNIENVCPPEGDAGTGMIATNTIKPGVGNISVGTSVFTMIVLQEKLKSYYEEIDIVLTPHGEEVAMIHGNNCTTEINHWVNMFYEIAILSETSITKEELFVRLFKKSLDGITTGIIPIGYHSGENITKIEEGYPLLIRTGESELNISNFMRSQLFSALGTMNIGMDILKDEGVYVEEIFGHGGFFKTPNVGNAVVSAALDTTVVTTENSSEGGAWGIAVLASYLDYSDDMTIEEYLDEIVFKEEKYDRIKASSEMIDEYNSFMENYNIGVKVENEINKIFKEV